MAVRRRAAIDCGTNSIRLLIADVDTADPDRPVACDIVRELRIVRLGEGVDATGAFAASALARTFAACTEYADLLRAAGQRGAVQGASFAIDSGGQQGTSFGSTNELTKSMLARAC